MTLNYEPESTFEELAGRLDGEDVADIATIPSDHRYRADVEAFLLHAELDVLALEFDLPDDDDLTLEEYLALQDNCELDHPEFPGVPASIVIDDSPVEWPTLEFSVPTGALTEIPVIALVDA